MFMFFANLLLPGATYLVNLWVNNNVKDEQLRAAWNEMMRGIQQRRWIRGSAPADYESAGREPEKPEPKPEA